MAILIEWKSEGVQCLGEKAFNGATEACREIEATYVRKSVDGSMRPSGSLRASLTRVVVV